METSRLIKNINYKKQEVIVKNLIMAREVKLKNQKAKQKIQQELEHVRS